MKYRIETVRKTSVYDTYEVEADTREEAEIKVIDYADGSGYGNIEGVVHESTSEADEQETEVINVEVIDE